MRSLILFPMLVVLAACGPMSEPDTQGDPPASTPTATPVPEPTSSPTPPYAGAVYEFSMGGGITGDTYGYRLELESGIISSESESATLTEADATGFVTLLESMDFWSLTGDYSISGCADEVDYILTLTQGTRSGIARFSVPCSIGVPLDLARLAAESEVLLYKYGVGLD